MKSTTSAKLNTANSEGTSELPKAVAVGIDEPAIETAVGEESASTAVTPENHRRRQSRFVRRPRKGKSLLAKLVKFGFEYSHHTLGLAYYIVSFLILIWIYHSGGKPTV